MANLGLGAVRWVAACAVFVCACERADEVDSSNGKPSLATQSQGNGTVEKSHCASPCSDKCLVVSSTSIADCCCVCSGQAGKYGRSSWSPTTYVCLKP